MNLFVINRIIIINTLTTFFIPRQQCEMEDSINNLGVVTTDKDVNDLAARHCEDAQVRK